MRTNTRRARALAVAAAGSARARRHRRLCAVVPGPCAVCEIVSTQLGRRRRPDAETHAVSGRHVPLPSLACCRCRPLSYPEEHAAVAVSRCPAFGRQGRRLITPRPSSKNACEREFRVKFMRQMSYFSGKMSSFSSCSNVHVFIS